MNYSSINSTVPFLRKIADDISVSGNPGAAL